jgi:hypothetical protein
MGLMTKAGSLSAAEPGFMYTMDQLNSAWDNTFPDNEPLIYDIFKNIKGNVFAFGMIPPPKGQPSTAGGFGGPRPGTDQGTGSQTQIEYFPVKNYSANETKLLLGSAAKLGLLKTQYQHYVGFQNDTLEGDPLTLQSTMAQRETAIDLERFAISVAFYLNAEKMAQKCSYYREIKGLGKSLGLDGNKTAVVPSGWQSFWQDAATFYQDSNKGFAKIPANICDLRTVLSRGAVEKVMKAQADTTIEGLMRQATKKNQEVLQNRVAKLGETVGQSQINIPVRGIFALEKGFRDTSDLLNLIKSDLLGLYSSKQGTTLLTQVKSRLDTMNGTGSSIAMAEDELQEFISALQGLLQQLEGLPLTKGLTEADRAELGACIGLSKIPGDSQDAMKAYQEKFDSCLSKTAVVYARIRTGLKDEPAVQTFADNLGNLTNLYLTQWK